MYALYTLIHSFPCPFVLAYVSLRGSLSEIGHCSHMLPFPNGLYSDLADHGLCLYLPSSFNTLTLQV